MDTQAKEELREQPIGALCFAAIDFESAGAAPGETDAPVQIGIIRAEPLMGCARPFESYLACHQPIHWRASKVHGITSEQLKHAPSLNSLWPQIKQLLSGAIIVGHNISTEQRFLRSFPGHGFGPWLDTLQLARHVLPQATEHALGPLCDALQLGERIRQHGTAHKQWHDALYDAAASLELLRFIVAQLHLEQQPLCTLDFALR